MKRRALFVGVNTYDDKEIRNLQFSRQDAHSLCDLFKDIGYETTCLLDPCASEVLAAVQDSTSGLGAGDSFLFYFAGHGFTYGKWDLLFCRDSIYRLLRSGAAGIDFDTIRLLTEDDDGTATFNRVFVLDACRSDFLTGTRGTDSRVRDLAPASTLVKAAPKPGSLAILRSCSAGQHALEVDAKQHGLFTCALLDVMKSAQRTGSRLAFDESFGDAVAAKMTDIALGAHLSATQTPDFSKSAGCAAQVLIEGLISPQVTSAPDIHIAPILLHSELSSDPETSVHQGVSSIETDAVETVGMFTRARCEREWVSGLSEEIKKLFEAELRAIELDFMAADEAKACAANSVAAMLVAQALGKVNVLKTKIKSVRTYKPGDEMTIALPSGVEMTFCWCPATTSEAWKTISGGKDYFLMGCPAGEKCGNVSEFPHCVILTKGFWMGKYAVTQRQWKSVMGHNPSMFPDKRSPVECVSWNDCQMFIAKVCAAGEAKVSLPTEAQWEYACRAGTTLPFSFGTSLNGDKANCDGHYPYGTAIQGDCRAGTVPVGSYEPNAWGICDMHGNVWEWCLDWHGNYMGDATDPKGAATGSSRVCRGGCWNSCAQFCRSAYRGKFDPYERVDYLGFRLVCTELSESLVS